MTTVNSKLSIAMISLLPEMFQALEFGITGRALKRGLLTIEHVNPRRFSDNKHGHIDDSPYGGRPGMVMMAPPLQRAIATAKDSLGNATQVIYLSPQGKTVQQSDIEQLVNMKKVIFLAGRYEGVDQRLIDKHVDHEWSIGDYILTGGELAAMVIIDAAARLLPNALGDPASAEQESFTTGLLDHPHYTRPALFEGEEVPDVLTQGNHQAISEWRMQQALGKTWEKRPDLLEQYTLSEKEAALLAAYKQAKLS